VIAFFITSLLGWSKVYEYSDIADSAKAKLRLSKSLQDAYAAKASVLEMMIGGNGGGAGEIEQEIASFDRFARAVDSGDKSTIDTVAESTKAVKDGFDKDMKSNSSAGADGAANMTYKNLIANQNSVMAKLHNELIVKTKENVAYRISTDAKLAQVKSDRAAIQDNLAKTQEPR